MTGLVTEIVTGLVTQQVNQRLVSCRSATTVCHRRAFEKLGSFKNSQLFCWILVNVLLTVRVLLPGYIRGYSIAQYPIVQPPCPQEREDAER